jgi:hypothetical protein
VVLGKPKAVKAELLGIYDLLQVLLEKLVDALEQARLDIGASAAWVVDQADGVDPLRPGLERRGFKDSVEWLPQ